MSNHQPSISVTTDAPEESSACHKPQEHTLAEMVIDLDAIAHNTRTLKAMVSAAELMAVVKADAYNHGMRQVVETILSAGATQLGVATIDEAMRIRAAGFDAPVTAWMWFPGEELFGVFDHNITLGLPSLAHTEACLRAAEDWESSGGCVPSVTLMFDSGLSRSGVGPREWEETARLIAAAEREGKIRVTGLMTHLASADSDDAREVTDLQNRRFARAIELCRSLGMEVPINHIANTPATVSRPDLHHQMVRPGVGIYGVDPMETQGSVGLRTAMTLRARVLTTRVVPAGEGVSYGHLWRAQKDTRTAVVALGYADGLPRSMSGKFEVTIDGVAYPQIGRVCMDQIVISLDDSADPRAAEHTVQPGDWAVIFGEGGTSLDEFSAKAETIPYEILTMPRCRVARRFLPVRDAVKDGLTDSTDLPVDLATPGQTNAPTAESMRAIGRHIGEQVGAGTVISLTGPLGAGKTTLTQGLAEGLGVKGRVQSPTFTIVRSHKPGAPGQPGLLHMDAYRLLGEEVADTIEPGKHVDPHIVLDALESLDLDADVDAAVLVAEWGRGVVESLSDKVLDVEILRATGEDHPDDETRVIRWRWV
ncbi:alanine racemase [Corynebacterium anserum]|uniref:Alanine racemase n=1 Tax=Corynebacterium anserum TaxID=2684406 RepID=A0A7G7YPX2_9CORY|nr:alanine racemase [Corynebacterium anserum]QNH96542.1 alanine racemase [Corynebacterium anserum]